ncbi:hypothetical protein O0L34_g14538 [Tuta absoluta]|nr:hypothetical protein O0L34_g14538 [Tuta absoluta]
MFLLVLTISAVLLVIDGQPTCTFHHDELVTRCTPGDTDYILQKGLISDNRRTTGVILRGCKITEIGPLAFDGLPRLKNLDLSKNNIEHLKPGDLNGARMVTHLNLSYNLLSELPKGLFDQKLNLELLDLKGNMISEFDSTIFASLTRLGFLDLSSNQFHGREFTDDMFPKNNDITFMDFSGSDMTGVKDTLLQAFKLISFLNLSGCSLYEVPKFATQPFLKTMKHLMLINNKIVNINDPNTFKDLENIEMLNFAGNSIESLHENVFKMSKKLTSVVLAGNKLKVIPDSLFKDLNKLTDIDLSNNLIENVPVNAFSGTALRNLNLSKNRFTYLSDNFLLELKNSGATVRRFIFHDNPWQCACLRDVVGEVKALGVEYTQNYDGKKKECVTTKEFACKRQPSFNQIYVDLYFDVKNE